MSTRPPHRAEGVRGRGARRRRPAPQPTPRKRIGWAHGLAAVALAGSLGVGAVQAGIAPPAAGLGPLPAQLAPGGAGESPDPSPSVCARRDPHAGIYHPDRLTVINPCQTVTGTVEGLRPEGDGDYHIRVKLDPPFQNLLNDANNKKQQGDLVVEIPCVNPVTQTDAQSTCAVIDPRLKLEAPKVGQHISITGPYVNDGEHGWNEIHPVYAWEPAP